MKIRDDLIRFCSNHGSLSIISEVCGGICIMCFRDGRGVPDRRIEIGYEFHGLSGMHLPSCTCGLYGGV